MNNNSKSGVKNAKFARWRLDLAEFNFDVKYRPGALNAAADALSRPSCGALADEFHWLKQVHESLAHPGHRRFLDYVKKLPNCPTDSSQICRRIIEDCTTCATTKPRWIRPPDLHVIKASRPWQRISVDFMVEKPRTEQGYSCILTVIDEYSRFPFAFATRNRESKTVIDCLSSLFSLFGAPAELHSDRGKEFLSQEFQRFLFDHGVRFAPTSPYSPQANGQVERLNGTIWKAVRALQIDNPSRSWDSLLPEALAAIRSLLCTATGKTPHDRFLAFSRQASFSSRPVSFAPGDQAFLRRLVRNKNEPLGDPVKIVVAYPGHALVMRPGSTVPDSVNIRHLAPLPPTKAESSSEDSTYIDCPCPGQDGETFDSSSTSENRIDCPCPGQRIPTPIATYEGESTHTRSKRTTEATPGQKITTPKHVYEGNSTHPHSQGSTEATAQSEMTEPTLICNPPVTTRSGRVVKPPQRFQF